MISGGDGGLAIQIQMNQFKIINEMAPCKTREEAESAIRRYSKITNSTSYGGPTTRPITRRAEFEITGDDGCFYIWMRVIVEDSEVPNERDGWVRLTGIGYQDAATAQATIDGNLGSILGFKYKVVEFDGLFYIYYTHQ